MREAKWHVQAGYGHVTHGQDYAFLHVERRNSNRRVTGWTVSIARLRITELHFNEDNGEVQLVKYVGAKGRRRR